MKTVKLYSLVEGQRFKLNDDVMTVDSIYGFHRNLYVCITERGNGRNLSHNYDVELVEEGGYGDVSTSVDPSLECKTVMVCELETPMHETLELWFNGMVSALNVKCCAAALGYNAISVDCDSVELQYESDIEFSETTYRLIDGELEVVSYTYRSK